MSKQNDIPKLLTFAQRREKYGKNYSHHLKLKCVKCGTSQSCRCSSPKTEYAGICFECCQKLGIDFETGENHILNFKEWCGNVYR